jgi:hypothetical protein
MSMLVLLLYTDVISAVFVNRQKKIAIISKTSLFSFGGPLFKKVVETVILISFDSCILTSE